VLTDGRTWSFYLPAEQGSYEDRRVYKLDLYERPPAEAGEILHRYLERARVESGEALEAARNEYRSRNRRSQAKTAIPEAWRELVEKGDELLVEMLTSAVESKVGVRPDADDVADFLVALGKSVILQAQRGSTTQPATAASSRPIQTQTTPQLDRSESSAGSAAPRIPSRTTSESARSGKLVILGKAYPYQNAKEALAIVLRELAKTDDTFLERCSRHPDAQGRTRRYIARTPEELYPDREDFRGMREPLPGGWFVATHMNNVLKKTIIRLAVEVAGLSFGKDVIVDL
jgi:hypothetical protein